MTWPTPVRTSHQVHNDFIIDVFFLWDQDSILFSLDSHVQPDNVTVATSELQNSVGFAPCISIACSMNNDVAHGCPNISSSPSWFHHRSALFLRYQDSRCVRWIRMSKLTTWQLQNQCCKNNVGLHRAFHQEMTWHTAVRTSHQVHHDFIIEMLFSARSSLKTFVHWIGTFNLANVTVAKSELQNRVGFASCISRAWSIP